MNHHRAFTLLELLAVVTVFLVLAAVLLSGASHLMQYAKASACATNLRSIGQAVALYVADNNGYLPSGYVHLDDGTRQVWFAGIAPYLSGTTSEKPLTDFNDVRYCPATSVNAEEDPFIRDRATWRTDYACNNLLFVGTTSGNVIRRVKRTAFSGKTIVAYDGRQSGNPLSTNAYHRHSGRINTLFLDNHIELLDELSEDDKYWKPQ